MTLQGEGWEPHRAFPQGTGRLDSGSTGLSEPPVEGSEWERQEAAWTQGRDKVAKTKTVAAEKENWI